MTLGDERAHRGGGPLQGEAAHSTTSRQAGEGTDSGGSYEGTPAAEAGEGAMARPVPSGEATDALAAGEVSAATSGGGAPDGAAAGAAKGPKVVRRVVCSYRLGWLPGEWLQTWRRLDRVFARANLKVKATLAPLEDLPQDTDILVVPPDLRDAAREAAPPGTPILVTPASAAAGAFAELVSRLEAGTDFTAEKVDPAEKDKPKIVSYRGHTLID
jgi:hypothetical protein